MPPQTEVGSSLLYRDDWSVGWQPSADQRHAARNVMLRADNLRLDELGVPSLRLGSNIISGNTALSSPGHVRAMHTCVLSTIRQRYAQVDGTIFRSQDVGTYISVGTVPDDRDAAMEDMLGQFYFAAGTVKQKNDGNATREWGISHTPAAPGLSATTFNLNEVSTFNDLEDPPWVASEGTVESAVGINDVAGTARALLPSTDTGKGSMQKVFATGQEFFNFPDGEGGAAEDLIGLWVWISNPDNLEYLTLMFDCNDDDLAPSARFRENYYYHDFAFEDAVEVKLSKDQYLDDRYDVEGFDREDVMDRRENRVPFRGARVPRRRPQESDNSGWARFLVPRASFERVGNQPGKSWSTVIAVGVTVQYRVSPTLFPGTVKIDNLDIIGGAEHTLAGRFRVRAQFYADYGTHKVLSAPSPFSAEVECRSSGLSASVDTAGAFDQHVRGNVGDPECGVEFYAMGGSMNGFYLGGSKSQHSGVVTVNIILSERDMLIQNVPLVADIQPPPDNIVAAVEHKNRMAVLDFHQLRLSSRFNPESFPLSFTFPVGNASFRPLWLAPSGDDLYVGTTIDIFFLEGNGDELPDGTTDFRIRRVGVAEPPISEAVASEGGRLIYLASDGPRALHGQGTTPLKANLDLLYAGETRYGVAAPNLGSDPGRFRFAMWGATLYAIVPEGGTDEGSPVLHVHDFKTQTWRREKYPFDLWSVYREPDGKILAGDGAGSIHQLAVAGSLDQVIIGNLITAQALSFVKLYAKYDDDNVPLASKEAFDIRIDCDNDGEIIVVLYADNITSPTPIPGDTVEDPDVGVGLAFDSFLIPANTPMPFIRRIVPNPTLPSPKSIQFRIGTVDTPPTRVSTFRLRSYGIAYRQRPTPRVYWDSGFLDSNTDEVWFRRLMMKMRPGESLVQVQVRFESGILHNLAIALVPGTEDLYEARIGRFVRGRLPRIVIGNVDGDTDPFELYWVEMWTHGTGIATEKRKLMVA